MLPSLIGRQRGGAGHRQPRVVAPPVQSDLFGLVDRAHEQSDLNRQQLDVREIDLDVASDDEPLVEDTVEDVDQAVRFESDLRAQAISGSIFEGATGV